MKYNDLDHFAQTWSDLTGASVAAALTCTELDALLPLFVAAGAADTAAAWIEWHDRVPPCEGHEVPGTTLADEFTVYDVVQTAAFLLGGDWKTAPGTLRAAGVLTHHSLATEFTLRVDHDGDLVIDFHPDSGDMLPKKPELPEGVYAFTGGVAFTGEYASVGVNVLAERVAATLRAVTAR
ncbi:hypothetical protein [Streptomyces niveus]|uniref:hypothetical protein n=1 Tax=Streptomyces niveus TaxID=193462 RepID=UPI00342333E0